MKSENSKWINLRLYCIAKIRYIGHADLTQVEFRVK
jgi:hypothetical protein